MEHLAVANGAYSMISFGTPRLSSAPANLEIASIASPFETESSGEPMLAWCNSSSHMSPTLSTGIHDMIASIRRCQPKQWLDACLCRLPAHGEICSLHTCVQNVGRNDICLVKVFVKHEFLTRFSNILFIKATFIKFAMLFCIKHVFTKGFNFHIRLQ